MSLEALNWAFAAQTPTPATQIVLAQLANYADERGACFPSYATLAPRCRMSRNTLRSRIGELAAAGYLFFVNRSRDNGGNTSNEYVLLHDEASKAYARSMGWDDAPARTPASTVPARQLEMDFDEASTEEVPDKAKPCDAEPATTPRVSCSTRPGSTACPAPGQLPDPAREPLPDPSPEPPPLPPDGGRARVGPEVFEEAFAALRAAFPKRQQEAIAPARKRFGRLSPADRADAVRYAARYVGGCRSSEYVAQIVNYLGKRLWEAIAEADASAAAKPDGGAWAEMVFIPAGSPQAAAWARHRAVRKLFVTWSKVHRCEGSWQRSAWPPGQGPPGQGPPEETASERCAASCVSP